MVQKLTTHSTDEMSTESCWCGVSRTLMHAHRPLRARSTDSHCHNRRYCGYHCCQRYQCCSFSLAATLTLCVNSRGCCAIHCAAQSMRQLRAGQLTYQHGARMQGWWVVCRGEKEMRLPPWLVKPCESLCPGADPGTWQWCQITLNLLLDSDSVPQNGPHLPRVFACGARFAHTP